MYNNNNIRNVLYSIGRGCVYCGASLFHEISESARVQKSVAGFVERSEYVGALRETEGRRSVARVEPRRPLSLSHSTVLRPCNCGASYTNFSCGPHVGQDDRMLHSPCASIREIHVRFTATRDFKCVRSLDLTHTKVNRNYAILSTETVSSIAVLNVGEKGIENYMLFMIFLPHWGSCFREIFFFLRY